MALLSSVPTAANLKQRLVLLRNSSNILRQSAPHPAITTIAVMVKGTF